VVVVVAQAPGPNVVEPLARAQSWEAGAPRYSYLTRPCTRRPSQNTSFAIIGRPFVTSTSHFCREPLSTIIMSAAVSATQASEVASSAARRRSGRVTRKPEKLAAAASPTGSAKRKRRDDDDSGVEADETSSEEQSESSEGEPDEEELRERRSKKKGKAPAKQPAPKKPRTNGAPISLAMRPATGASRKLTKRPRKAAIRKSAVSEEEPEGLYGMRPKYREIVQVANDGMCSRRIRERRQTRRRSGQLGRAIQ
jgi:hypothetical protein